jgi:hypothetical protein
MYFRDRFRTMINVWGDSTVTAIVAHLSRQEVADMEKKGIPDIHIPGHDMPHDSDSHTKSKSNQRMASLPEIAIYPDIQKKQFNLVNDPENYPHYDDRGSHIHIKF